MTELEELAGSDHWRDYPNIKRFVYQGGLFRDELISYRNAYANSKLDRFVEELRKEVNKPPAASRPRILKIIDDQLKKAKERG